MNILHHYLNGGYKVTIYEDGTKTRQIIPPQYPESIDIKITNKCNLANHCKWCHESSHHEGKHADLDYLYYRLLSLSAGVELAIGGGNPLEHPVLPDFLNECKKIGLICNITINQMHVNSHSSYISKLIEDKLVNGIGITYSGKDDITWLHGLTPNVVYHVIAGIHHPKDIENLPKTLILGYKMKGKGKEYYSKDVENNIHEWYRKIPRLLGNNLISFDNVAIEQLNIKRLLTAQKWEEFYMGDDGTFTFYIDAVNKEYAISSTSEVRYLMNNKEIPEMFKHIRNKSITDIRL